MKKLTVLALITMLLLSLAGCATTKDYDPTKIKCPSCGYEFDIPENVGG